MPQYDLKLLLRLGRSIDERVGDVTKQPIPGKMLELLERIQEKSNERR
jgi:hypothetical protein